VTETKSFSLPEKIAEQIELYARATRLNKSTIATMAFEIFLDQDEVKQTLALIPTPTPNTNNQS